MIEYNFYVVTRVNNDMTSYNDKNDAVANKNAGGGVETCMSLSLALLIIIFINFFIRVFSECTEAVATILIH